MTERDLDFDLHNAIQELIGEGLLEEIALAHGNEGGGDQVAAMICEPVMGAGGVIVPPKGYYEKIQAVCRKYDMLFVVDEVICAFGRTGKVRGSQTLDILTCAKALSASFLPISAVMISDKVYQALASESDKIGTWGYGFTYSGHPVAVAVALEAQKIYHEIDLFGHAERMSPIFQKHIQSFADHPLVGEAMGVGMFAALEVVADKKTKAPFDLVAVGAGNRVYNIAWSVACSSATWATGWRSARRSSSTRASSPTYSAACARRSMRRWPDSRRNATSKADATAALHQPAHSQPRYLDGGAVCGLGAARSGGTWAAPRISQT
jgi:acetylornithine/succinyldiaminopimelate/putrescine aminotransferase